MATQSRRMFLGTALAAGAAGALVSSCGGSGGSGGRVEQRDSAPDGPVLTAALVGCGGRGTGAAVDFLDAGPNLQITALADVFRDRLDSCRERIKSQSGQEVPEANCFIGFDAYQKAIDSGVDIVLLATPPHFRPMQFEAAIAAGKHVFMEKPVAVDPPGIRSIIQTAGQAKTRNLSVVTGTQRRHQRGYLEVANRVADGMIGDIVAARCYWNQGKLWHREREAGWTDMEWMIRDWVNWCWLSGDHIVEQHVHNLDVINWFTGSHPVQAVGFGGRARRVTGDQYDFFSVDYEFENGMHLHSMCRQIDGCNQNVSEFLVGTNGSTNCANTIWNADGSVAWRFDEETEQPKSPYKQEHIDFVTSIRTSSPINEAENTAISTMAAIMGRTSAYTGAGMNWQEMEDSEMRMGPEDYALGPVDLECVVPVPGTVPA